LAITLHFALSKEKDGFTVFITGPPEAVVAKLIFYDALLSHHHSNQFAINQLQPFWETIIDSGVMGRHDHCQVKGVAMR